MRARALLAPVLAAAVVVVSAAGAAADVTVTSSGPLVEITTTSDLNCAVRQQNDNFGSWYQDTACGTFLAVGSTLLGPATVPGAAAAGPITPWTATPTNQTSGGDGTTADPFTIVTTVSDPATGIEVVQTDTYVEGDSSYLTDVAVTLAADRPATDAILYRAGDCQVDNSNFAFGNFDPATGVVSCQSTDPDSETPVRGDRVVQLLPSSEGSKAQEGQYSDIWAVLGARAEFSDECVCEPPEIAQCDCRGNYDNGIGLSWALPLQPGQTLTRTTTQTFTPLDLLPLVTKKSVDTPDAAPGETVTYEMSVTNPNATDVTVETMTDLLPEGFSYVAGTTTGVITTDPTETQENGRTRLTWLIEETLGRDEAATIFFDIVVSGRSGTYDNEASGTADREREVAPFEGAPVTVSSAPPPVVPEVPVAVLLPLGALGLLALAYRRRTA